MTSVFVTHDREGALEVSDRVVVMHQGRIEQVGTPDEVYDQPATPFVYRFLGDVNPFHGRAHEGGVGPAGADGAGENVTFYVRPHKLEVRRQQGNRADLGARVHHVRRLGNTIRIELERADDGGSLEAELSREHYRDQPLHVGELVYQAVEKRTSCAFFKSRVRHMSGLAPDEAIACALFSSTRPSLAALAGCFSTACHVRPRRMQAFPGH